MSTTTSISTTTTTTLWIVDITGTWRFDGDGASITRLFVFQQAEPIYPSDPGHPDRVPLAGNLGDPDLPLAQGSVVFDAGNPQANTVVHGRVTFEGGCGDWWSLSSLATAEATVNGIQTVVGIGGTLMHRTQCGFPGFGGYISDVVYDGWAVREEPPLTTTTTTSSTSTTTLLPLRCCYDLTGGLNACLDTYDVANTFLCEVAYQIAPLGEVCDGITGQCAAVRHVGASCCQVYLSSLALYFCYEYSSSEGATICDRNLGTVYANTPCGPVTHTCGGP